MKQMVQKLFMMCVLASIAGLAHGYNRTATNPTPYKVIVYLNKISCKDERREILPYQEVTFNDDGCLIRGAYGQIYYENPNLVNATTGKPLAQWMQLVNNFVSGGIGSVDLIIQMRQAGPDAIPQFSIREK